jgi:hypothetical protein
VCSCTTIISWLRAYVLWIYPLGKGGKYKKKSGKAKHTLTQDDIEFLKKNTRYDEQEIKEWYR